MKDQTCIAAIRIAWFVVATSACSESPSRGQNVDAQNVGGAVSTMSGGASTSSRSDTTGTGGALVVGGAGSVFRTTSSTEPMSAAGNRATAAMSATSTASSSVGAQGGQQNSMNVGGTTLRGSTAASSSGGVGIGGSTAATSVTPTTAGAAGAGCEHATGVELTASVGVTPFGGTGIVGRWCNGTSQTIFLGGCNTVDGEYLENGGSWQNYGGFILCTWEGYARELGAGQSLLDGGTPPNRGSGVWRLVGTYGVGCTSAQPLSQANCAQVLEATSNQLTFP